LDDFEFWEAAASSAAINTYEVDQNDIRLDCWLAEQLPEFSRSRLQKLIEQGQVQVNHQICTSKKRTVHRGDRVQVQVPEPQALELRPVAIPLDILYEDDVLLIVNKPAGLVVHPAPGHPEGTLVQALLAHCHQAGVSTLSGIGGVLRPGIVHRLDKDTSGAIAIAKTDQAHQHLQAQIQAKTAKRYYLGVVYGGPREEQGCIDLPIGRHPVDRKKMAVVSEAKEGRRAITYWQVQERLGNYTLMQFQLETGRTHQIRVHTAHLGQPIVGDPLYGSGRSVGVNLTGQALHAWRLGLRHPVSEAGIEVIAPLPQEFTKLLEVLRRRQSQSTRA